MKSWISFLMPNDEYKEKQMLYFFAEGGILLFVFSLLMAAINTFFPVSGSMVLLIFISIFLFYMLGRYIFSGMEYANVAAEKDYKKETKAITIKASGFVVMFGLFYIIYDLPDGLYEWVNTLGVICLAGIGMFLINFISLKRSYLKNKELL